MKIIVLLVVLLAGCAELAPIRGKAGDVADAHLTASLYSLCNVQSVGAWVRRFGSDKARAEAWRVLCASPVTETPQ